MPSAASLYDSIHQPGGNHADEPALSHFTVVNCNRGSRSLSISMLLSLWLLLPLLLLELSAFTIAFVAAGETAANATASACVSDVKSFSRVGHSVSGSALISFFSGELGSDFTSRLAGETAAAAAASTCSLVNAR